MQIKNPFPILVLGIVAVTFGAGCVAPPSWPDDVLEADALDTIPSARFTADRTPADAEQPDPGEVTVTPRPITPPFDSPQESTASNGSVAAAGGQGPWNGIHEPNPELHAPRVQNLEGTDAAIRPLMTEKSRAAPGDLHPQAQTDQPDGEATALNPPRVDRTPTANPLRQSNPSRPGYAVRENPDHSSDSSAGSAKSTHPNVLRRKNPDTIASRGLNELRSTDPHPTADLYRQDIDAAQDAVQQTSHENNIPAGSDKWETHLEAAISALTEQQHSSAAEDVEPGQQDVYLRLLYLAAGRRDDAVRAIEHLDEDHQQFWSQMMHGLSTVLNDDAMPVADRRAALAAGQLRDAVENLANASTLDLRNLTFCTRVDSYGQYTKFQANKFSPNQEVLLYVEIANFTTELTDNGYETSLLGSYRILDTAGRRVADHTFHLENETCRNRRRDYFIPYRIWFPKRIHPGQYTLQLMVEDVKGLKFGQASVEFTIQK